MPEESAEKLLDEEKVDMDSMTRLFEASSPQASEAPEGGDLDEDAETKSSAENLFARLSEATSLAASQAPGGGGRDGDVEPKSSAAQPLKASTLSKALALMATSDFAEDGLDEAVERWLAEASSLEVSSSELVDL